MYKLELSYPPYPFYPEKYILERNETKVIIKSLSASQLKWFMNENGIYVIGDLVYEQKHNKIVGSLKYNKYKRIYKKDVYFSILTCNNVNVRGLKIKPSVLKRIMKVKNDIKKPNVSTYKMTYLKLKLERLETECA